MKILFNDSGRFLKRGGYPSFSRGLLLGLSLIPSVRIGLNEKVYAQAILDSETNKLIERNKIVPESEQKWDVDIYLGNIHDAAKYKAKNSILVSGYPFLGIDKRLKKELEKFKYTFTSGRVDSENFSEFCNFDLPQPSSISFVNGNDKQQASDTLKILFVGTFNYWKGIDQVVQCYIRSNLPRNSRLTLKCPVEYQSKDSFHCEINRLKHRELFVSLIGKYISRETQSPLSFLPSSDNGDFSFKVNINGENKEIACDMESSDEQELIKIYDSHDVLLHLSRGETWSMPIIEALLRGLTVILPSHYGCANYIQHVPNAYLLNSTPKYFSDYDFSDRSSGGGRAYLAGDTKYFEISLDDAATALSEACNKSINDINPIIDRLSLHETFGYANIGLKYHEQLEKLSF